VKLADTDSSMIPPELLGCHLIGVYNSLNEDMPDNFYYCIYVNENDDLLRVLHLYKLGNVSAAFFYTGYCEFTVTFIRNKQTCLCSDA
jgi:hypothetical protein